MLDRHLRPKAGPWMEPTVERLLKRGTKPDTLTALSLLLALGAALLFYTSPAPPPLPLLAGVLVLLSGGLDALDGALARKIGPTKRGDFLDHAFDRFGDVLLLGGIVLAPAAAASSAGGVGGGAAAGAATAPLGVMGAWTATGPFAYVPPEWGFAALAATLLTSYLGTQGQALGLGRVYGGVLGRLDRLLAIPVVAWLQFLLPGAVLGFTLLGWLVVGFAVLGGVTVVQRFVEVWKKLKEKPPT